MQKSKFQKVVEILIKQGLSDEQIAKFCEAIAREGMAHLMEAASEHFTPQDMKQIEALSTQEEVNTLIKKMYAERVGKDAEEEMQKYIDSFSYGFLAEHQNVNPSQKHPHQS